MQERQEVKQLSHGTLKFLNKENEREVIFLLKYLKNDIEWLGVQLFYGSFFCRPSPVAT